MKSLNQNLFENLPLTELEERLEMAAIDLVAVSADKGTFSSCSSIDCIQHSVTPAEEAELMRLAQTL